jgi:hypothetical protein
MPLYRVEEEGEEARKAVGGGARRCWRRSSPGLAEALKLEHPVMFSSAEK